MSLIKAFTPQELIARGAPQLFTTNAKDWTAKLVDWFESHPDGPKRTLFPAQVEMVLIHMIAYALSLLGKEAQFAADQRWILFATGNNLDVAAANNSTFRLKASSASCTLQFALAEVQNSDVFVAKGTHIGTSTSAAIYFVTQDDLLIRSGDLTGTITAHASEPGTVGNGFDIGEISKPLDLLPATLTVTNMDASTGGAAEESDDALRFRAMAAHDRISKAGPIASYKQQVRAFSPSIVDVEVTRPQEGHIWVYPLLDTGAPNAATLSDIDDWMSPLDKRPQGDNVTVKAPEAITFTVSGTVRFAGDPVTIQNLVEDEIARAALVYAKSLGQFLAINTLTCGAGKIEGVVDIDLTISGPANRQLEPHQFGLLTGISLTMEAANV